MSLILDALKKIEREKGEAGEKGVLVLGAVPWGEKQSRRTSLVIGATLGVLGVFALGAVATWWLLRPARSAAPAAAVVPSAAVPATAAAALPDQAPPRAATAAPSLTIAPAAPLSGTPGPAGDDPLSPPANPPVAAQEAPLVAPASNPAPGAPEVRLTAISHRDGQPVALVNDRLVREGDSFDGISILRIGDAEVEVEVRGQRRVIRF